MPTRPLKILIDVVRQRAIGTVYQPFMRWGLSQADTLLATSPNYVVSSPELVRLAHKCLVVPIGIDVDRFAAPRARPGDGPPFCLWVVTATTRVSAIFLK